MSVVVFSGLQAGGKRVRQAARNLAALLVLTFLVSACTNGRDENGRVALPLSLAEVSGLAAASDTSVFAHNDEHAIVHELRVKDGKSLRYFALGDRVVAGDFEGIATADGSVYLVTSGGLIYTAKVGGHRERMPFEVFDTGIGAQCEIEGLARAPSPDHLLVLCKQLHGEKPHSRLEIYRWEIGSARADTNPWLSLALDDLVKGKKKRKFKPSALEWDAARNQILVASARSRDLLILDASGVLVDARELDKKLHPQTEGLTIIAGKEMILADEGNEARRAFMTSYPLP